MCKTEAWIRLEVYGLEVKLRIGENIVDYTIREGRKYISVSDVSSIPHHFHSLFGDKGTIWDRGIKPWNPYGYKNYLSTERAKRELSKRPERRELKLRRHMPLGDAGRRHGKRRNDFGRRDDD